VKRVVLDTNLFVSMALGGQVGKINDRWKEGKFLIIVSDDIVSEYLDVLQRPKLRLSARTIAIIINHVYRKAKFVVPEEHVFAIQDNPSDNKFIEAAIAGGAEAIVSGDNHIVRMKKYRGIPIIAAGEFLEWLDTAG
jgi:putative PIN family toxin of toxin-antitoxin system